MHRGSSAKLLLGWGGTDGVYVSFPLIPLDIIFTKGVFGAFSETLTTFEGVFYKLLNPLVFPIDQCVIRKMCPWYNIELYRNARAYMAPELA